MLLAGVLFLALVACGGGGDEETPTPEEEAAAPTEPPPTEVEAEAEEEEDTPQGISSEDAGDVEQLREFPGAEQFSFGMKLSPDGSQVAVFGSDAVIRVFDVGTGDQLQTLEGGHSGPGSALAYSPDGTMLVSGGEDFRLTLWDLGTGDQLFNVVTEGNPGDITFTPDGERIVFIGLNNTPVFVYDLDGNEVGRVTEHGRVLGSVDVSPDGTLIASGNARGNIVVSDADSLETETTLNDGTGTLWATKFSPDGGRLAAGSGSGDVWIWDTSSWNITQTWLANNSGVRYLTWSPDGSLLVTVGADGEIVLWNPDDGRDVNTFQVGGGAVWKIDFAQDGSFFATLGGNDAMVRIFGLP